MPEEGGRRYRFVLVVARSDPKLHRYLSHAFAGVPGVEVVLDRRQGERRRGGTRTPDLRHAERRIHPADLREFNPLHYKLVRVPR